MASAAMITTIDASPADAEARVREALAEEGFGILSEIDVEATLRAKLGEEVGAYKILGACSPPLASRALAADPDVGVLLPCNVVLRANADGGGTDVLVADPDTLVELLGDALTDVAADARTRLKAALERLEGAA